MTYKYHNKIRRFVLKATKLQILKHISLLFVAVLMLSILHPAQAQQRNNLYFTGDFEQPFLDQYSDLGAAWHELNWITSPTRVPGRAMRAQININEYNIGGGRWRAQLWHHGTKTTSVNNNTFFMGGDTGTGVHGHNVWRWYAFSVYVPNDWVIDPIDEEVITTLHEDPDPCETWRFGPLDLKISHDKFSWQTAWDSRPCTPNNLEGVGSAIINETPLDRGKWVDWVLRVRWDYRPLNQGGQGFIEIWKDGVQQPTYYGPNCYNDQKSVYQTIGPYKWVWNNTSITSRYLYVDELRIGQGHAVYADVAPGRSPIGSLDSLNSTNGLVSGWSLDSDRPYLPTSVHFYIDGTFAGSASATIPRPDVNQATGYLGDHGFNFTIPAQYLTGSQHTLYAYGIDLNGNYNTLIGSRTFGEAQPCSPPPGGCGRRYFWDEETCSCQLL